MRVVKGSSVTWFNADNAAHTVTSGSVDRGGPDGEFDSSMIMSGNTYSARFDSEGTYPYFCMLHPWQSGYVIVERGGSYYQDPAIPKDTTQSWGYYKQCKHNHV